MIVNQPPQKQVRLTNKLQKQIRGYLWEEWLCLQELQELQGMMAVLMASSLLEEIIHKTRRKRSQLRQQHGQWRQRRMHWPTEERSMDSRGNRKQQNQGYDCLSPTQESSQGEEENTKTGEETTCRSSNFGGRSCGSWWLWCRHWWFLLLWRMFFKKQDAKIMTKTAAWSIKTQADTLKL